MSLKNAANFKTLLHAVKAGRVSLVECRDARTEQTVECLCAMNHLEDGQIEILPLARMHTIEDLNTLQPPNPDGGFYPASPWEEK